MPIPETNPCGASLSANCFNGEAGCVTHPTREMLEAAWERVDPDNVKVLTSQALHLRATADRPYPTEAGETR